MAVQKRRQSKARRDSRRAQWMASFKKPSVALCPKCSEPRLSHRVCVNCGFYGDRQVIEVAEAGQKE